MTWERDYAWEHGAHEAMRANGWPKDHPMPKAFRSGELLGALVGCERIEDDDPRWHISVHHRDRVPNWDELVDAAHKLRPGVCFIVGIPPRSWWINVHPYVLHLWESQDVPLRESWRAEQRGDPVT